MLDVSAPNCCKSELAYIVDTLLCKFLGLDFKLRFHNKQIITISCAGSKNILTLNSDFFIKAQNNWLNSSSMPGFPLRQWNPGDDGLTINLEDTKIPILYGEPILHKKHTHWHLAVDIFGSSFFMLSRYEEAIISQRDSHNRFPAEASVAVKCDFIDRPIVNEYTEVLWNCLKALWPKLVRKERKQRTLISCDVDHPFDLASSSLLKTINRVGARLIRDRAPKIAIIDALNYVGRKLNSYCFDNYRNSIYWMMESNNIYGNKVAFNFIPIQTNTYWDNKNIISDSTVKRMIKDIYEAGHEVGFHPGYGTYNDADMFKESADKLISTLISLGITPDDLGGRQHYLMYDIRKTPRLWSDNGFMYDSSLGYSNRAGFRCGTCYEYGMYDLENRLPLNILQRPLIVMESTIILKDGLRHTNDALSKFNSFKYICMKYKGDFTLLWHNSSFIHDEDREFYLDLIGN